MQVHLSPKTLSKWDYEGGDGIAFNAFRVRCFQPLSHLSGWNTRTSGCDSYLAARARFGNFKATRRMPAPRTDLRQVAASKPLSRVRK
jgi:hypothetical protein